MLNRIAIITCLVLTQGKVCGQDTIIKKKVREIGFDKVQFRKVINQQFGSLISGLSKTPLAILYRLTSRRQKFQQPEIQFLKMVLFLAIL